MLLLPSRTPQAAPKVQVLLASFFKDLPKLTLVFLLVCGAAGAAAWLMRPGYVAEALLYVKYGREYTYRAATGEAEIAPQTFEPKQVLKAEARILAAPDLVDEVVARLGVATLYPDLLRRASYLDLLPQTPYLDFLRRAPAGLSPSAAASKRFMRNFDAEAGEDGNVIAVRFQHPDRTVAIRALNELVGLHMTRRRALFAEQRAEALRPEVEAAQARLVAAESTLDAYRNSNGIVAFDTQRAQLLARKDKLQGQLADAERERNALVEQIAQLRTTLQKTPSTLVLEASSGDSGALIRGREALLELRLEERKLLARFTPASHEVREIRARIAQAERFVNEQGRQPVQSVRRGRNPIHDTVAAQVAGIEADLAAAESRRKVLGRQLAAAGDELALLDAKTAEVSRLTRERDLAEQSYRLLAERLSEAKVLDEVSMRDAANLRVAQSALAPAQPQDLRPLILALGMVAAFVAALMTAFFSDLLRRGFLSPEQLAQETGLPVLAAFPVRRRRSWNGRRGLRGHGPFAMSAS
jgi:uncharacterized protein involved in exopolysaccharide biosynthesis